MILNNTKMKKNIVAIVLSGTVLFFSMCIYAICPQEQDPNNCVSVSSGSGSSSNSGQSLPAEGFIDMHAHLAAELSFGGGWFWGNVEGPLESAMHRCSGNFPVADHATTRFPFVGEFIGAYNGLTKGGDTGVHIGPGGRNGFDTRRCRYFLGIIKVPGTCPATHFSKWPSWDSLGHQQMWEGWLRSAHRGELEGNSGQRGMGLRIMIVSLAESRLLCEASLNYLRRFDCNEMASVDRQIEFVKGFVSRNSSWVGIATSPQQARDLIAQEKLVLLLAVEIDELMPQGDFIAQLDSWRERGVSVLQPAHLANSRFAGAAPMPKLISTANIVEAISDISSPVNDFTCRDSQGYEGKCDGKRYLNELGLTADGRQLIQAMVRRGMLIDVAHLSRKAIRDTYNIVMKAQRYPLLYSHAHFDEVISPDTKRNEKYILPEEIEMIKRTGGMVGLRTGPEKTVAVSQDVANNCQGSSRSFAQSLTYGIDQGLTMGIGSDLNGFIHQMLPRVTDKRAACWGSALEQSQQTNFTHNRFAFHGLGDVRLLPNLIEDLEMVGLSKPYLDHLNNSSENFLRIWERAEAISLGAYPEWLHPVLHLLN